MQNQGRKEGLTLLEVVVTIFLVSIIGAAILNLFDFTAVYYNKSIDKERSRKEARFATQWIKRDVSCNTCLYNANATSLSLNVPDWGFVKYYLANNTTLIRENGCSSSPQLVSKNLTDFNLTYYDAYNQLNVSPIRLVEVNVASQVGEESDRGYIVTFSPPPSDCLWAKTYNNDTTNDAGIYSIQQTADGGYIMGGYAGSGDLYIKTDLSGTPQWEAVYGIDHGSFYPPEDVLTRTIRQTQDKGYIIGTSTTINAVGASDWLIIKTFANGTIDWAKTYGDTNDERIYSIKQTPSDNGYIVGGISRSSFGFVIPYNPNILVMKTNPQGDIVWAKLYDIDNSDAYQAALDVNYTSDGYVIVGEADTSTGQEGFVIKTDENGNFQPGTGNCGTTSTCWVKQYGGQWFDNLLSVKETTDGYILLGTSYTFGPGGDDFLVIRTDFQGNLTWARAYGGGSDDEPASLKETSDGFILGGYTKSFGAGNNDILVIKTDENGNFQAGTGNCGGTSTCWVKAYGGTGEERLWSVDETQDGYIMGGSGNSFSLNGKEWFLALKTGAQGNVDCCENITNVSNLQVRQHPADFTLNVWEYPADFTVQSWAHGTDFNVTVTPQSISENFPSPLTSTICPQ